MCRIIWTICICSIPSRKQFLSKLLERLLPQVTAGVQVLIDLDSGDVSVGAKRHRMINNASGEYVNFIDDDDLVSDSYVSVLLKALESGPDAVGFRYTRSEYTNVSQWTPPQPNHLTPVKREIALSIGFNDLDAGEDNDYTQSLIGSRSINNIAYLDDILYHYQYRNNRAGEVTHASRMKAQG